MSDPAAHGFVSVPQGAVVPLLDLPVTTSDDGLAPGDGDLRWRVGSRATR